jgi:hypothetical protein
VRYRLIQRAITGLVTTSVFAICLNNTFSLSAAKDFVVRPVSAARHGLRSSHGYRVVLYGDSLAAQSQAFFVAALAHSGITHVTTRAYGGTAICDWIPDMRADAAQLHPDAVVVEFSGNNLTPCMRGPDGKGLTRPAYYQKYRADAAQVFNIFGPDQTLVFLAGSPINQYAQLTHDLGTLILNSIYSQLAQIAPNGRYIDAGASVLLDGHWTKTLPCLPGEPCTGGRDADGTQVNVVRAPDGAHFCPGAPPAVHGVTATCPVWSSGAWRFAHAMAAPVIGVLLRQPLSVDPGDPRGTVGETV